MRVEGRESDEQQACAKLTSTKIGNSVRYVPFLGVDARKDRDCLVKVSLYV
jgi:hypothetical protein